MRSLLLVLLMAVPVLGAEPGFNPFPPLPAPVAPPAGSLVKLTGKQVYVASQATPFVLRAYPASAVSVKKYEIAAGETHHFEKEFADGTTEKSFKGPQTVYFVVPTGKGVVDLVATPFGFKQESEIKTVSLDVDAGQGPQPPPKPEPEPKPKPEPNTPSKLFLLVVEETSDAVAGRGVFFADAALSARVKDKEHTWRVVDKDVTNSQGQTPSDLVPYLAKSQGKKLPQLFLVDPKGNIRFQGDMPANPAAFLKTLTDFGG